MMGRDEEGFQCLQAVLKRVKPDGSIRILPDHHKETAVALSTIVRQCELRNDDDRLREMWPVMLRGMEHLRRMRMIPSSWGRTIRPMDCSSPPLETAAFTARSRNIPRR